MLACALFLFLRLNVPQIGTHKQGQHFEAQWKGLANTG